MVKVTILTLLCSILVGLEAKELGVKIERNVPVPMRDGTILRADVHRPDRVGPYPVLVQRTQYGKSRNFDRFVKAGYIVVSQDVRGRYKSEGKFESNVRFKTHDAEDGYDTVEWAAKIPCSNGKVGTFGCSYLGFVQLRLAPLRPPSLLAMSASGIDARYYLQEIGAIPGGALRLWVKTLTPDMRRRANRPGVHTEWEATKLWREGESEKWLNFLPRLKLPQEVFEDEAEAIKYLLKDPRIDPWKLNEGCKDISVPNLELAGWYDPGSGDLTLYKTILKQGKTEIARTDSRIIIGPWTHGTYRRRYGNIDFGPNADIDRVTIQIRWFDYWLKGKQNGVNKDAPVRIFVMGDNQWRDEQHWPLQKTKEKVLFITSKVNANTPGCNGKLVDEKPDHFATDKYVYDPKNPVPSLYEGPDIRRIPTDRRPLADRKDILVYETEPLTERIEVTGNPTVELHAASSAPDTDWYAWLIDVAPDGLAREVSVGKVRARYRDGFDTPKLIKPGEVVKYIIRMNPTSNAFLPGHRIRLDITSSDFPNYDRNHNIAANPSADATMEIAKQTIYHGGEQATRIILPWVPNPRVDERRQVETKILTTPLHQAEAEGNFEQVKLLISKGADINAKDEKERTPLHYAIEAGKKEVIQLLVKAGADVNAGSWPPLYVAVDKDNLAIAEYLIAHGADVNAVDEWTALQEAPYASSIEMIELLIAKGADVNAGLWTALHGAVKEGRRDIAELLIQKGADVNAEDKWGHSPLYYAIQKGDLDTKKLLIAKGADIEMKPPEGLTLLQYVASEGHRDIAELLLTKGAKVDEKDDEYEFTALHYAARFGHKDMAEFLIAKGADINAKDKWDYQPIHIAAHHDRADVVKLLIANGADINAKTSLSQTPLQLAEERRNKETIELLLKHGAE